LPKQNGETRCYFPNYRLGKWTDSPCDTLGFRPAPDNGFKDTPWSENRRIESTEEIKVLKLPPGFQVPASKGLPTAQDYNPLNMKTLMLKEMGKKRQMSTSKQKPKHD
jgi:hypothetical protein